ncbi:MAG TPA: HdeD family acid-resistance protein [Candidatus Bathyarchaeia archaeon]|nr:HdeD family acid-resistance protein [Candidatus Bathyarchaeia archaeon]
MADSKSPGWKRGALIGLGAIAIVLSILVLIHPGMTVVSIVYVAGIVLIIVGIEKIISGIFVKNNNKSRWGTVGLGILALIFGSIAVGYPVHAAVFVIIMLGIGLLFAGISHVVNGIGNKESPGWSRGFSIGAGALAIALSFLILASPHAGAVFVSLFLGIALLIIGIEVIAVGWTGRRMQLTPTGVRK